MTKSLLATFFMFAALSAGAKYNGEGYYRVQNLKTDRWCSVIDDNGSISYATTSADLHAIRLQKNFDVVCADPASVVRIYNVGGKINIEAQGVSISQIIGHYADLTENGVVDGDMTYLVSGTYNGFTKYLGDSNWRPVDIGSMQTNTDKDYRRWHIFPLDETGDNFFGVQPTVDVNGKYYSTMYADFPFSGASEGVKAYYISAIYEDMLCLEPLEGAVGNAVPVIFECASDSPADNRLKIEKVGAGRKVTDNKLSGRYICFTESKRLANTLKYDPDTMRVLGKTSTGEIGFITDRSLELIPANTCYLKVAPGSPAEYRCVDKATFIATGVDEITLGDIDEPHDVMDINGRVVIHNATPEQIEQLPHGVYIINGHKYIR